MKLMRDETFIIKRHLKKSICYLLIYEKLPDICCYRLAKLIEKLSLNATF